MDRRLAFSALLFTAANLLPDEKTEDTNTEVTGTVSVPKDVDSFEKTVPERRSCDGDPPADLAELLRR